MQFDVDHRPSYATLTVTLDAGESIHANRGSMVARSAAIESDTTTGGGGLRGALTSVVSDERELLSNVYESSANAAELVLAPDTPGDVARLDLAETGRVKAQSGGVLAWGPDVEKSTAVNEAGNLFSSGELTVLSLSGAGRAFLSAYGAVHVVDVSATDPMVVDEDHVLAWTDGLSVSRERDGSIKSTFLGGEGFVTRFEGDGRVWLQTRDPAEFVQGAQGNA